MALYQFDEVDRLANLLATNARLKLEYAKYASKSRKLLLVEGASDAEFVEHVKANEVDCVIADHVFNSNQALRTTPQDHVNCKDAIVMLILGISHFPSPFVVYPDDMDKWDLYGLVDRDCEELRASNRTPRLFVTDTRDLETLLMSTDSNIWQRIEKCEISRRDVSQAVFIAYQLAKVRELLTDYHDSSSFDLQALFCGSHQVSFSSFVQDGRVNLKSVIQYVTQQSEQPMTKPKQKKLIEKLFGEKSVKKRFNMDGEWKQELSAFDYSAVDDVWTSVNGHDVLQLIRYYNENAYFVFSDFGSGGLNRNFEFELVAVYDYGCFDQTELCRSMRAQGILRLQT